VNVDLRRQLKLHERNYKIARRNFMKLTVSQANAVNTINSNLQIVACAGSGKTTTMVARILNLLKQPSVNPENIVAVTYSKKAAVSLKQKIYKEYEKENKSLKGLANMYIGTIHGYCYFLLQNYSDNYKNYELLEEVQTRLFMKRFRKEIVIILKNMKLEILLRMILTVDMI
jgi:DNA helicase II / ATP-dependent DNA helicase PcrA